MADPAGPDIPESAAPLTEEELLERLQEEMRRITVPDFLAHALVSLSSMAFQRLGLTSETAEDVDLAQSRMAIDAFEAVSGVLSDSLGEQEASLYRTTLHQMRLAFVRVAGDPVVTDDEPASDAGDPVVTDDEPAPDAGDPVVTDDEPAPDAGDSDSGDRPDAGEG